MGTIGDLLGDDFSALFADQQGLATSGDVDATTGDHVGSGSGEGEAPLSPTDTVSATIRAALRDELNNRIDVSTDPMTLKNDCDLDALGLYSVITSIEHELRITLSDSDIAKLETISDLTTLVLSCYGQKNDDRIYD